MIKDVKVQAEHAQKEIKCKCSLDRSSEKQKGTSVEMMEMMNTTLEEAKRKAHVLHVRVVGWAEKGSPQECKG